MGTINQSNMSIKYVFREKTGIATKIGKRRSTFNVLRQNICLVVPRRRYIDVARNTDSILLTESILRYIDPSII